MNLFDLKKHTICWTSTIKKQTNKQTKHINTYTYIYIQYIYFIIIIREFGKGIYKLFGIFNDFFGVVQLTCTTIWGVSQ